MATNPNLIPGNLNRVRASVIVPGNETLNIPAQFQAKEGIVVAPQSAVVTQMQGMTTIVNSEEPYQLIQITVAVIKSLAISAQYLNAIQNSPVLGNITVVPDTSVMPKFSLINASIINWNQISMAGLQPDFTLVIQGQYNTSNDLWNLV